MKWPKWWPWKKREELKVINTNVAIIRQQTASDHALKTAHEALGEAVEVRRAVEELEAQARVRGRRYE
jgi:hypothetical protein